MALMKCPECGRDISDRAKACIHCGYPIPRVKEQPAPIEPKPVEEPVLEQTIVEPTVEAPIQTEQTAEEPGIPKMDTNQKKVVILIVAVIAAAIALWAITSSVASKKARERDLSDVFDVSFSWTMEDVIKYEAEEFGNTEYEFDEERNRLDFEPYHTEWKHRYFFDKETGILKSYSYSSSLRDYNDGYDPQCEHAKALKKALLKEIGEWDEKATGDSVRSAAYGQVDGVPVKILFFDLTKAPEIHVYRNDD